MAEYFSKGPATGAIDDRLQAVERVVSAARTLCLIGLSGLLLVVLGVGKLLMTMGELHEAKSQYGIDITRIEKALDLVERRVIMLQAEGHYAAPKPDAKPAPVTVVDGTIDKIDGTKITVALRDAGRWECEYRPGTIVKVNGARVTAKDLREGMTARFVLADRQDGTPLIVDASTLLGRVRLMPSLNG